MKSPKDSQMNSDSKSDQERTIRTGTTKRKIVKRGFVLRGKHGAGYWLGPACVAATCFYAHTTQAATRYWDVNGTALGFGGTGTWNTTSAFWSPNNDGVSGPFSPWNNAALDDAFFGGT